MRYEQHGACIVVSYTTGGNEGIFIVIDEADTDISLHIDIAIKSAYYLRLSGLSVSTYIMMASHESDDGGREVRMPI
ncbi:hypothetical protein EmuJ_000404500 [Echinococcus multilocularis]|uniref:Uncharacterized protein n=1 Tax=Echinococcus multilocularis TaxID=6211 RepID=U6HHB9_ECHMU|nr:hypothetical protein EmuJ_000024000 [Echinococcus multilocularis]CDS36582.1 hypothetical protein EmuJ_000371700 [Echinococcus multilocularis]CDS36818.1 hypothetical protein EmuJ_000401400 [Echinococcus multilocularis]CDS36825.1 hypothetical protein EmuJ_000403300 [Echinococcus multilocularis]CDS36828.1 hypothetical protein EmuJ_000403600 [Echinococcus multilocularis]